MSLDAIAANCEFRRCQLSVIACDFVADDPNENPVLKSGAKPIESFASDLIGPGITLLMRVIDDGYPQSPSPNPTVTSMVRR